MKRAIIAVALGATLLAGRGLIETLKSQPETGSVKAGALSLQSTQAPSTWPPQLKSGETEFWTVEPTETPTVGHFATMEALSTVVGNAQETAWAAQETAGAVNVELIRATAEIEQQIHSEQMASIALDQSQVDLENTKVSGTQTAAPSAVPATETQQAKENAFAEGFLALESGKLTATVEGPELTRRQNQAKYAGITSVLGYGLGLTATVCVLGILRLGFKSIEVQVKREQLQAERDAETDETWNPLEQDTRFGLRVEFRLGSREWHDVMPCNQAMLVELADRISTGETLGVNKWEGSETIWTREYFEPMLAFLVRNRLASEPQAGNQSHRLTTNGGRFFRACSSRGGLPTLPFVFAHEQRPPTVEKSHMSENHTDLPGGGVVEGDANDEK